MNKNKIMLMLIWNEKESISTHNIVSNPGMKMAELLSTVKVCVLNAKVLVEVENNK